MPNSISKKIAALAFFAGAAFLFGCGGAGGPDNTQSELPRAPRTEYSLDKPGEWVGLEAEHVPKVVVDNSQTENVSIIVKFPIKHDPDHYIEKIGIMDKDGNDVIVKKFNRDADFIGGRFILPEIKEGYRAYARCSLHDLWVTPLETPQKGWFNRFF